MPAQSFPDAPSSRQRTLLSSIHNHLVLSSRNTHIRCFYDRPRSLLCRDLVPIYRRHAHNEVVTQRSARTPSADMNLPPSSTYLPTPSLATLSSWNSKCHIQQIVASFEMLFYALCDTILYSSSAVAATAFYGLRGGDHLSAALAQRRW